jgi:hypothetical protein
MMDDGHTARFDLPRPDVCTAGLEHWRHLVVNCWIVRLAVQSLPVGRAILMLPNSPRFGGAFLTVRQQTERRILLPLAALRRTFGYRLTYANGFQPLERQSALAPTGRRAIMSLFELLSYTDEEIEMVTSALSHWLQANHVHPECERGRDAMNHALLLVSSGVTSPDDIVAGLGGVSAPPAGYPSSARSGQERTNDSRL